MPVGGGPCPASCCSGTSTDQQARASQSGSNSLSQKITASFVKADSLIERLNCCMWIFGLAAVWLLANALYTLHEGRKWARFIAVSSGRMPWSTPAYMVDQIMYDNFDVQPSQAEFSLYEAMLITAAATLVMGIATARVT